jgi:putative FmdB family regulatory protein
VPLFDLKCPQCGAEVVDVLFKSHRSPNPPCRECGSVTERKPSAPNPAFKGPGFYATDYAK